MVRKERGMKFAAGLFIAMSLMVALVWAGQASLHAQDDGPAEAAELNDVMKDMLANPPHIQDLEAVNAFTPCTGGMAAGYPCENIDLLSFTPIGSVGGGTGADAWGWIDPLDGKEYAIMNRQNGTGFLDITDPENPIYLGNLPTSTGVTAWRDAKVYSNTVYIVSDGNGAHGMQIFDLTNLRNVVSPPVTFTETNHYNNINSAHNMVINEESGYGYIVGGSGGGTSCSGGLHMLDLSDPHNPVFVGCHTDHYSHDAQCVNYIGPDPDHQGDEICIGYDGNTSLHVIDVTDKGNTQELSSATYPQQDYTHQGWFTDDHRYFIMNDELDEGTYGINTRTRVFDVTNLDASPILLGFFSGPVPSTDHNLYLKDGYVYAANYQSGLRLLDMSDVENGNLSQAGYFDTYTPNNNVGYSGAWTAYPYYDSGNVIINSRGEGLFVVRPRTFSIEKSDPTGPMTPGGMIEYTITVTNNGLVDATGVVVTDTLNGVDTVLSGPTTILVGDSETYTFSYTLDEDDCGTTFTNSASVSADNFATKTLDDAVETQIICGEPADYFTYMPYAALPE